MLRNVLGGSCCFVAFLQCFSFPILADGHASGLCEHENVHARGLGCCHHQCRLCPGKVSHSWIFGSRKTGRSHYHQFIQVSVLPAEPFYCTPTVIWRLGLNPFSTDYYCQALYKLSSYPVFSVSSVSPLSKQKVSLQVLNCRVDQLFWSLHPSYIFHRSPGFCSVYLDFGLVPSGLCLFFFLDSDLFCVCWATQVPTLACHPGADSLPLWLLIPAGSQKPCFSFPASCFVLLTHSLLPPGSPV